MFLSYFNIHHVIKKPNKKIILKKKIFNVVFFIITKNAQLGIFEPQLKIFYIIILA